MAGCFASTRPTRVGKDATASFSARGTAASRSTRSSPISASSIRKLLDEVGRPGSFLGGIPDVLVPGIETTNGSLGLGLGVGCGMALALRRRRSGSRVFVLVGDGELNEGSVWEAVMFAAHQRLANLILIVEANQKSMLGYCDRILNLSPLEERFRAFGWHVRSADGHDVARGPRRAFRLEE